MQPVKNKICSFERAFTLVEVLAALTVGTMVLIVVMALYNRGQSSSAAVINRMEGNRLPREIFQRIAEDLDRVVGAGQGTQIDILNKFQDGFPAAKIEILRNITDAKDQSQIFEKIIWQRSSSVCGAGRWFRTILKTAGYRRWKNRLAASSSPERTLCSNSPPFSSPMAIRPH